MSAIAERVAKGAACLDKHEPGWADRVNLEILDVGSCFDCVVGQVFGEYGTGREHLGWSNGSEDDHLTVEHGFAATGDAPPDFVPDVAEYPLLTAEWKRVIEARRAVTA